MLKIRNVKVTPKGKIYSVDVNDWIVDIMITWHALDRMETWNLNIKDVLETLLNPEEVLTGHSDRFIAHRRVGDHVIRAIYEYEKDIPVLVTVYLPKASRYFRGGGFYADKILP